MLPGLFIFITILHSNRLDLWSPSLPEGSTVTEPVTLASESYAVPRPPAPPVPRPPAPPFPRPRQERPQFRPRKNMGRDRVR